MSWSSQEKKKSAFFVTFILPEGKIFSLFVFFLIYSVFNKFKNTYTFTSYQKNIISYNQWINLHPSKQYIFQYTAHQIFFYIFTTAFYDGRIFVDATNNYQLTESSNLQTNLYAKGTIWKLSFIFKFFKWNSLY